MSYPGPFKPNSLGEEIQKTFPSAKVVKTLNTMWCGLMINPNLIGGGNHTNFICGNDADAKAKVKLLLNEFGWKNENLLDLGDISNAAEPRQFYLSGCVFGAPRRTVPSTLKL